MGFARNRIRGNMFSQRHYEAIAERFNDVYRRYHSLEMDWAFEPLNEVTSRLTILFRMDNPNFSPNKFETAIRRGINET